MIHPDVAAQYATLKKALMRDHPVPTYTVWKLEFLRNVAHNAQRCGGLPRETNWTD
jgi:hypothetical protein